jgi:site-specific recombinase XerD
MLEFYFQDTDTIRRLRKGLFGKFMDSYASELKEAGYSYQSAQMHIRLVEGFGGWLRYSKIDMHRVNSSHIEKYICYRNRKEQQTKSTGILTALKRILRLVATTQLSSGEVRTDNRTPAEKIAEEFDLYLVRDRALTQATTRTYGDYAKKFLKYRFKTGGVDLSLLRTKDVLDFVRKSAGLQGTRRAKLLVTSLRSFFRFAKHRGYITLDLEACVPTVPNWSKTEIPRALSEEKVKTILSQCKRNTTTGRRDYAILLLLARLGLRAGEVARLRLDDIDWKEGQITVQGKGRKMCQMPLPADVGEAIASYLKDGRPRRESRVLFLQRRAPFDRGINISGVVARAIARSGVETSRKGAHQFRHGLAIQMLKRGASLSEIGEILRHASVDTTTIYAKVDIESLRSLALPWPGGRA